ncbi:hypothetical protein M409DRAFT_51648 [Zasmidium cellare ATCC 36951]|uniref:Ecp2 effector protein domain-containing protein n=1 Tax=Zasmidium cellare ATCC 36951 TaxID=1080233 RepID=A0A6A6CVA3_ZASCE|nr:uncharacterized protein M409DRAFT_51648 [Zasmidium cellare ATCC 36951]KAF2170643.1 hypothetical protein M409DRAFT_51648 [Zasmidium cellare ATCC 36951]
MKMKASIATAFIGLTGVLAAPAASINVKRADQDCLTIARDTAPVDVDSATCRSHVVAFDGDLKWKRFWQVHVGVSFNSGDGCKPILATMLKWAGNVGFFMESSYLCEDDGFGDTLLSFVAGDARHTEETNEWIIEGLQEAYPMILFKDDHICVIEPAEGLVEDKRSTPTHRKRLESPIEANAGTCANHVYEDGRNREAYEIFIGWPWNYGYGCEPVRNTLHSSIPAPGIMEWYCLDDGSGNTRLPFEVNRIHQDEGRIDEALAIAYPDVKSWVHPCRDGHG